jgi:hypothetical protein
MIPYLQLHEPLSIIQNQGHCTGWRRNCAMARLSTATHEELPWNWKPLLNDILLDLDLKP